MSTARPLRVRRPSTVRRALVPALALSALAVAFAAGRRSAPPSLCLAEDSPPRDAEPLRLVPKSLREGRPIRLEAGEIYLLDFLQGLADSNARQVYLVGVVDAKRTVRIEKSYTSLSFDQAVRVLAAHGLLLSEEELGGNVSGKKDVYWVQPKLEPVRRRGSIVRPGGDPGGREDRSTNDPGGGLGDDPGNRRDASDGDANDGDASDGDGDDIEVGPRHGRGVAAGGDEPDLRVYRRSDGGLVTWLVQYETRSRQDAGDIVSIIRATLDASRRR